MREPGQTRGKTMPPSLPHFRCQSAQWPKLWKTPALVLAGELANLLHPRPAHFERLARLLGRLLVTGILGGFQFRLELSQRLLELRRGAFRARPRLGIGALPLFLLRAAYRIDNGSQPPIDFPHVLARHLAGFVPAFLYGAQLSARPLQVFDRHERLGLSQELELDFEIRLEFRVFLFQYRIARGEELILRGTESGPQCVVVLAPDRKSVV